MRWFWIDRYLEFEVGKRAVAIKNCALGEDVIIDGPNPMYPALPSSLIVEGVAQAGGLLVAAQTGFHARVVLGKVTRAVFSRPVFAGETIVHTVELQQFAAEGALVRAVSRCGEETVAEMEVWFAQLDAKFGEAEMFTPAEFLAFLRMLRVFEVGLDEAGNRLEPAEHLLADERDYIAGRPD